MLFLDMHIQIKSLPIHLLPLFYLLITFMITNPSPNPTNIIIVTGTFPTPILDKSTSPSSGIIDAKATGGG
jgi:hypothetical protein